MKNILLLILFFSAQTVYCQSINLIPYKVTNKLEGMGTVGKNNNKLFFNLYKILYGRMIDSNKLIEADTSVYEVRTLNLSTMVTDSNAIKSNFDTINFSWTNTPYFNKYNYRYYFGARNIARINSDTILTNLKRSTQYYVESYDSNLKDRKLVKLQLPSEAKSFFQCNKIMKGDSLIFAIAADTNNIANPLLYKLHLNTGAIIDSVHLIDKFATTAPYGHSGFIQMDWINDSVMIILSDYLHYININSMTLLDTFLVQFPIWQDYNPPRTVKFNISDSSYIYNGELYSKQYFYKIKNTGIGYKLFEVPIATFPIFQTNGINTAYLNFDYKYLNHIYSANTPLSPLTDTFALCHSNINGITDWIKIIKTPSKCGFITVIALEDSTMFAFVQLYQPNDKSKYDIYYIKTDQFGNQIYPLGVTKSDLKIIDDVIIYPNPTNGQFYIGNLNLQEIETINILSINGQKVKNINKSLIINIDDLPAATYFIEIQTKNKKIIKRIIKN